MNIRGVDKLKALYGASSAQFIYVQWLAFMSATYPCVPERGMKNQQTRTSRNATG